MRNFSLWILVLPTIISIWVQASDLRPSTTSFQIVVPDDYPTVQEAINNAADGDTIYVRSGTYHENIIINKTISLIGENQSDTIVDGNGVGNVLSIVRENVIVSGLTIRHSGSIPYDAGIYLDNASRCVIDGNTIAGNKYGIMIYASSNYVTITGNNVTNNDFGLRVFSSSHYGNISRNHIANHSYGYGIGATSSNYNSISSNMILNNYAGILLGGKITGSSSHNSVFQNTISESDEYGIEICGYYSQNNTFYHNNLVSNNHQAIISPEASHTNFWDNGYPYGGNYWSDHNPFDEDLDKIGDAPYVIASFENNTDRYPLIYPHEFYQPNYEPKSDVNEDGTVNIMDIAAIAKAYACKPGDSNWNPIVDLDINGKIDILDIATIAKDYGKTVNQKREHFESCSLETATLQLGG